MEIIVLLLIFGMYILICGLSIANYIIYSLALYKIACKRRVSNAWLAWLPIGTEWILGSVTDSFDEEKGKAHSWRKVMLTTSVLTILIMIGSAVAMIIAVVVSVYKGIGTDELILFTPFMLSYAGIIVGSIVSLVLTAALIICYYRIFDEIYPGKTVKYLIFTLVVPLAAAICMLKCSTICPEKINPADLVPDDETGDGLYKDDVVLF